MCNPVSRQNKGEDYTLPGHRYLLVGKLIGWKTRVDMKITYGRLSSDVTIFFNIYVVFTQILI